jgi:hypothetical protein
LELEALNKELEGKYDLERAKIDQRYLHAIE